MNYDFIIGPCDTDSVSFCKSDMSPFIKEERENLIKELNNISPEFMIWADDGYFEKVLVIRAKNYVLWDGEKLKIKGSSLIASTKEPALQEVIKKVINSLIHEKDDLLQIYNEAVRSIYNITDMKPWASRKTITKKTLTGTRANERKPREALIGSNYVEGDRVYMFFKEDGSQCLLENFTGDYSKDLLLKKLYDTFKIFKTVIDFKQFKNYKLKRNQKELEEILK